MGGFVSGDALVGEEGDQALLEGAESAFDFAFGLRRWSNEMGDAQCGEGALEFGARIATVGGGLVAEKGQTVGVDGQGTAMTEEGASEVLEMVPCGVDGDKGGGEVFAGVIVDGEEQGLLGVGGPPGMDGGIVLPEFADLGALPAASGFWERLLSANQVGKVETGVVGDGLSVAVEGEPGDEFVCDQLVVGRPLEGQKGSQEASNVVWPRVVMVATGRAYGEGLRVPEPGEAEAEEVGAADAQEFGSGGGVEGTVVEGLEGLKDEILAEAMGELGFVFSRG